MTRDEDTARRVVDYITNNLGNSLNIHILSDEFQISRFTLQRIFKQVYGCTVHQFISKKRMEKAYHLLAIKNDPIKIITNEVGFKSIPTFTKKFHRKYKMSPAEFRDRVEN